MISKRPFLVDTSSDLCIFTRKLIPRRRELVNYDLYAAKGTTIPTYGWLSPRTMPGLHVVVGSGRRTQPFIGVDFISHFGLLLDWRNNCLLDGVTSFSSPARSRIPRIKTVDSLLTE
jgi:hypothetical protein